jgi:Ulp1 family protease
VTAKQVQAPIQDNWHDCGLYMLHYIEIFLEYREELVASFLARDNAVEPMIWRDNDIKGMRTRLFNLICKLQKEYDALHPVKATSKAKVVAQPPAKAKASPGSVDDDTSSKMPSPQRRIESPGTQIILEANSAARTAEPATETAMDYQLDNEEAVHERELSHLEQKENHHTKNRHSSLKAKPRTEKRHRVEVEVTGTDDKDDEDSVDVIEMVVSEPKLEPEGLKKNSLKSMTRPVRSFNSSGL